MQFSTAQLPDLPLHGCGKVTPDASTQLFSGELPHFARGIDRDAPLRRPIRSSISDR